MSIFHIPKSFHLQVRRALKVLSMIRKMCSMLKKDNPNHNPNPNMLCRDQALFKTLQQGSEHTDTHYIYLILAMRYSFAAKLSLFSSKLQLVQNPLQGSLILSPYIQSFVPTHMISKYN